MRYFRENPELSEIDPRDYAKIEDRMIVEAFKMREAITNRERDEELNEARRIAQEGKDRDSYNTDRF